MTRMIRLLLLVALSTIAVGEGPRRDWQGDPDQPWVVGGWSLACRRDGSFHNGVYIETCRATMRVGAMALRLDRSPDGVAVTAAVDGCARDTRKSIAASRLLGADRAGAVAEAVRLAVRSAGRDCRAPAGPVLNMIRVDDVERLLRGSDGLEDMTR